MAFHTYIMASRSNAAIFIGVAGNLGKRVTKHKLGHGSEYTAKNNITKLVYFETHDTLTEAFARERYLKRWQPVWKDELPNDCNPDWLDLGKEVSAH